MLASVYVCVWVSLSLFSFIPTTASSFSFFTSLHLFLSLYLSHPLPNSSTIQAEPVLPSLSLILLLLYTPANFYSICASVWLLAWSVWRLRRRESRQLGGALRLGRKSACGSVRASEFSIATSKPRRLSKLYQEGVCCESTLNMSPL